MNIRDMVAGMVISTPTVKKEIEKAVVKLKKQFLEEKEPAEDDE